jgi:protein-tyrosine-phosphatase
MAHQESTTVVLLFAEALSAPEVHWDLVDAGYDTVLVARAGSRPALRFSRSARLVHVEDPGESIDGCLRDLSRLIARYDNPIVMPLDDPGIWLVHALESTLPLRVCGPTGRRAQLALDKRMQLLAAARAGFHVPATNAIADEDGLGGIQQFPCVVKPALAARSTDGALGRGKGLAFRTRQQRDATCFQVTEPLLAQPHIQGVGEGVFGLALAGQVVAWSGHRRVRMLNPAGSGSSACESMTPGTETLAAAARLVRSIGWQGLFMIELLRDAEGKLWFIELNGRPWGSMALSLRQGLRYPSWAVRALLEPSFIPTVPPGEPGLLCRHAGRELVHLAFVARGPGATDVAAGWPSLGQSLRAVLDWRGRQALYNWRRGDPGVFLADLVGTVSPYLRKAVHVSAPRASILRRLGSRLSAARERVTQRALQRSGLPLVEISRARSVLFVCYGNINRSALAERRLQQAVQPGRVIRSCGFFPQGSRAADQEMVSVAGAHGVDLTNWSSRIADAHAVREADVIFAMEAAHLVQLYGAFPEARGKSYLLGALLPASEGPLEINDPFGRSRAAYEKCFREVVSAIAVLADHFRGRPVIAP